jgi:hypothetical protein
LHDQRREEVCEHFGCAWLELDLAADLRPDRSGGIILAHGDLVKLGSNIALGGLTKTDAPKLWEINFLSKQAFCQPPDVLQRWIYWQAKKGIVVCNYDGPGCGSTPTPNSFVEGDIRIHSRLPFRVEHLVQIKRECYGDMLQRVHEWQARRKQAS